MPDKFHVYRPLLDLIGHTEGTDRGRGYDETLAYGRYTGSKQDLDGDGVFGDVDLVGMTLTDVDKLQTKMLRHPSNAYNSSACGRYQIVRTTLRRIRKQLALPGTDRFDREMQDRMACFLLGQRGIDKYLAGRLSEDTLLRNLAQEWASLPTPSGEGHYNGQKAAVGPQRVRNTLAEVVKRHRAERPGPEEAAEKIEEKVKERTSFWQKVVGFFTGGGLGGGLLYGLDWQALAVILGAGVVVAILVLLLRRHIVAAAREIREGLA